MPIPSIHNFPIAKYQITLEATSTIKLPPYSGSTLRGAFGNVFKSIACKNPTVLCKNCELRKECPHFLIYENTGEFSNLKLSRFKTPPKPFIFEPPMSATSQIYETGQIVNLNLVLVGRSLKFFPYFIIAFKEMGIQGIGKGRGNFVLKQIEGNNPVTNEKKILYTKESDTVHNEDTSFLLSDFVSQETICDRQIKEVTVEFITPTRIKSSGSYGNPISFKVLIQTLLTRVTNMAYNYCGQSRLLNFRDLVNQARDIEVTIEKKQWQDVKKFQTSNNTEMLLGGYVGQITYEGEITPFWPWLKLGEILHLGKNCAFGLGQYAATLETL